MEQVVSFAELGNGVVQITMMDRSSRNTFSKELVEGIVEAFEKIKSSNRYKVVILTGYENYFCCGGTKEELIAIYREEIKFNDLNFFTMPMDCDIPVISAMQGHGIGGGFVFGLYSDFIILGRENVYTTNFMKYGFTPGMGATHIVPLRLGNAIGNEMLYTAENYRGAELKEKGCNLKVVPKIDVLKEAIQLANCLAEKPRLSLITLKAHLTTDLKAKIPSVIDEELEMHTITFHQPEVAERIQSFFGK